MWSLQWGAFPPDHVLPASIGEEAVVTAADQLRPVLESDLVRRLDARPLVVHARGHEPAVRGFSAGSVYGVPHLQIPDRHRPAICHQDPRSAPDAVGTRMAASPIRVDRPAERHLRLLWHTVED